MNYGKWVAPILVLAAAPAALAATKAAEPPDKEMLRMLEFLRDMEMIKQMEMLKELQDIDAAGSAKSANTKPESTQKKGSMK